ncbi:MULTISPECIES: hypothetical protein [Streptomyces]|uniref:Uncharacterized protein n=1 Tax=Streptomyces dengpaensis TaxID=2049881 RepID=A0ABM6SYI0_9ACTN|nr:MULTISPECIES: hypothetical protein [Streptomyces]AVH59714.1 hypothetical protein C4B68_32620 [Streptomyces dengpaensis]PIB09358.1 hypothetical protein B1C81_09300 [Streptomyces sp. HG99]
MKTTMDPPITLELPLSAPDPAPGCGVCQALARQRAEALAAGNASRATDCNVEIRNHPHPTRAGGTS